jgi:hypothetical protein
MVEAMLKWKKGTCDLTMATAGSREFQAAASPSASLARGGAAAKSSIQLDPSAFSAAAAADRRDGSLTACSGGPLTARAAEVKDMATTGLLTTTILAAFIMGACSLPCRTINESTADNRRIFVNVRTVASSSIVVPEQGWGKSHERNPYCSCDR